MHSSRPAACLLLCIALAFNTRSLAQHELIDGPANVRNGPVNGKLSFTLNDSIPVVTADSSDKTYLIALQVRITADQAKSYLIGKDVTLYNEDGKVVGKTIGDGRLMDVKKKGDRLIGVLWGYTAERNIRQPTLPENRLGALLASGAVLTEADCEPFIQDWAMSASTLGRYRVYVYDGRLPYRPGALTRLMLLFDSGKLLAVLHLRALPYTGGQRVDLNRGYFLTVPGQPADDKVQALVVQVNQYIERENGK